MPELTQQTQNQIIIGIIVGAIIAFLGFYFRKKSLSYQEFLRASKEFREVFKDTIIFLDEARDIKPFYTSEDFAYHNIEINISKHEEACKKFLPHLGIINHYRFNTAWQQYAYPQYKNFPKNWNIRERFDYMNGPDFNEEIKIRKLLRKKINKLLKFAKAR